MTKEQLTENLKENEFIGKVYIDQNEANKVAINKAVAHREYGFRVVEITSGFAVVGRKKEKVNNLVLISLI